jgi:ABC-type uncharacterized transport system permease subunit
MHVFDRWGYRATLYLAAVIAALHCMFSIYAKVTMPQVQLMPIHPIASVLVVMGLWLTSSIARYAGAAYYFLTVVSAAYAPFKIIKLVVNLTVMWAVASAILSLLALLVLLLSKRFAAEFAVERENQPAYKRLLLHTCTALIVVAVAYATVSDIVQIVSG